MQKFAAQIKARNAAKRVEEKKAPPWSFNKGWHKYEEKTGRENPKLMSERDLMVRGTIGHNERSIEAIVGRIIGRDRPIYARMASYGTLAFVTFRNEDEATYALAKIDSIKSLEKGNGGWSVSGQDTRRSITNTKKSGTTSGSVGQPQQR